MSRSISVKADELAMEYALKSKNNATHKEREALHDLREEIFRRVGTENGWSMIWKAQQTLKIVGL